MAFREIAKINELTEGQPKVFLLDERRVALCKRGSEILAFDDVCTHDDGPLAEGVLEGDVIECPRHGAKFNIRTGVVLSMPAPVPINTYAVKIDGDKVLVDMEAKGHA